MKILGVDLPRAAATDGATEATLVALADDGRVAGVHRIRTLPELAATVSDLAAGEPFLLGVDAPIVVPPRSARGRPVENLVRRRLGVRLPAGGRAALGSEPFGVAGEALLAGLAAAGHPSLPYPDRDRRRPCLAETYPALILKGMLWEGSEILGSRDPAEREELFRAYAPPAYHAAAMPARSGWAQQAVALDLILRALHGHADLDLQPVHEALARAQDARGVEQTASLLDAVLVAGMARRYLETPETCLFVGDREGGYVILPADSFVRRLGSDARSPVGRLFPRDSLHERLGTHARVRQLDLLSIPGKPQRFEATFVERPVYEFDNLDEMLWWKHTRHLAGPQLPVDGLQELIVSLDGKEAREDGDGRGAEDGAEADGQLRLVRSRHRTLSFRFEPPAAWRARVHTRDGRTYPFHVVRAVYETLPA